VTLYEGSDAHDTTDEYATDPQLWRPLSKAVGGFDTDPASGAENEAIAETVYTRSDNGLAQSWNGVVWLNPPFSNKEDWYRKAVNEVNADNAQTVIALAPVDTSTQWFHNWFAKAEVICWLEGRDWYVANSTPSFNTAVGVFGDVSTGVIEVLERKGVITEQITTGPQTTL